MALMAALGCLALVRGIEPASTQLEAYKRDFSAAGIDPMPVGTAKQMARLKRARAVRKA